MARQSWAVVSEQLDCFFVLPLANNETIQLRAIAIESYLVLSGWTWDQVLDQIVKPEGN
jgi:hypothetical protein